MTHCIACGRLAAYRVDGLPVCGYHRASRAHPAAWTQPQNPWDRLALTANWMLGSSQESDVAMGRRLPQQIEGRGLTNPRR